MKYSCPIRHEKPFSYRTIGFSMVAFGFLMVFTAFLKSCKNITNDRNNVSFDFNSRRNTESNSQVAVLALTTVAKLSNL